MDILVELEPNLHDFSHLIGKTVMLHEYAPNSTRFTGVAMLGQLVGVSSVLKPATEWTFHFNGGLKFVAVDKTKFSLTEVEQPLMNF